MRIAESAFTAGQPNDLLAVFQYFYFLFSGLFITRNGAEGYFDNNVLSVAAMTIVGAASLTIFCQYILVITQVEECPEVSVAFQDDVCAATAVAAIGTSQSGELIAHEMFVAGTAVAAATKNSDLVYKVAFLHKNDWWQIYPMLRAWPEMKDPGHGRDLIRPNEERSIGSGIFAERIDGFPYR